MSDGRICSGGNKRGVLKTTVRLARSYRSPSAFLFSVCFRRFGGSAVPFPLNSSAFETEFWVAQTQELLQEWEGRRVRPRMEITGEGLMLGAGTILAKTTRAERGAPRLALDDKARAMALLVTAYERPIAPYVLEKIGRAAELWNEGEKALAHIHLAHAGLPPCTDEQALRLFVADELLNSGVAPAELMKAQGFDLSPMALLKFNPDQPRVLAGSGRESREWSGGGFWNSGSADVDTDSATLCSGRAGCQVLRVHCRKLKGNIMREFPSEYLDLSVDQVLKDAQAGVAAAKKAKKLLFDNRFRK